MTRLAKCEGKLIGLVLLSSPSFITRLVMYDHIHVRSRRSQFREPLLAQTG